MTLDVNANQSDPGTLTADGIAALALTDPAIALEGSGTADASVILLHWNKVGLGAIRVAYKLLDLHGAADSAASHMALPPGLASAHKRAELSANREAAPWSG